MKSELQVFGEPKAWYLCCIQGIPIVPLFCEDFTNRSVVRYGHIIHPSEENSGTARIHTRIWSFHTLMLFVDKINRGSAIYFNALR